MKFTFILIVRCIIKKKVSQSWDWENICKSRQKSDPYICYGTLPAKVSKISLEGIYEAYRNVKGVIENASASKAKCYLLYHSDL